MTFFLHAFSKSKWDIPWDKFQRKLPEEILIIEKSPIVSSVTSVCCVFIECPLYARCHGGTWAHGSCLLKLNPHKEFNQEQATSPGCSIVCALPSFFPTPLTRCYFKKNHLNIPPLFSLFDTSQYKTVFWRSFVKSQIESEHQLSAELFQ